MEKEYTHREYKKKILIAMHPEALRELDHVAKEQRRGRSEIVREAIRHYVDRYLRRQRVDAALVKRLIDDDAILQLREEELPEAAGE